MRIYLHIVIIFSLIVIVPTKSTAQLTKIMGIVIDAKTGDPVSFANVFSKILPLVYQQDLMVNFR